MMKDGGGWGGIWSRGEGSGKSSQGRRLAGTSHVRTAGESEEKKGQQKFYILCRNHMAVSYTDTP